MHIYICMYVCIHIHIAHLYLPICVNGNLDCFHTFATVNYASVNIWMYILFELVFLVVLFIYFFDIYPGVELLDNILVLFLVF